MARRAVRKKTIVLLAVVTAIPVLYFVVTPWVGAYRLKKVSAMAVVSPAVSASDGGGGAYQPAAWLLRRSRTYYQYFNWCYRSAGIRGFPSYEALAQ